MSRDSISFENGDVDILSAYVDATYTPAQREVTWESDNTSIATVERGVITGVSVGTTAIKASLPSGYYCKSMVTVTEVSDVWANITAEETYNIVNSTWGIDGTGVEFRNSTVAIQTMLNWASANGYRKVVFPSGNYKLDDKYAISVPSNMVIDLNSNVFSMSETGVRSVAIDTGTDVLTLVNHEFYLGQSVRFTYTSAFAPTYVYYYVIPVTENTFKVATSLANAIAGTAINFTNAGVGVNVYIWHSTAFIFKNTCTNSKIINGEIVGSYVDGETRPIANMEGLKCINFSSANNCRIEYLYIHEFNGHATTVSAPSRKQTAILMTNWELGDYSSDGTEISSTTKIRTIDRVDISSNTTDNICLDNTINLKTNYLGAVEYDIVFYDVSDQFISKKKYGRWGNKLSKPTNAYYARVSSYTATVPTTGESDYANAIGWLSGVSTQNNIVFKDCTFKNGASDNNIEYSEVKIVGCTYEQHVQPNADPSINIVFENGWRQQNNNIVKNCTFNARGLNYCVVNGSSNLSYNNTFNGMVYNNSDLEGSIVHAYNNFHNGYSLSIFEIQQNRVDFVNFKNNFYGGEYRITNLNTLSKNVNYSIFSYDNKFYSAKIKRTKSSASYEAPIITKDALIEGYSTPYVRGYLTVTLNIGTDIFTSSSTTMVTGQRVRLECTGTYPTIEGSASPVTSATEFFVCKINATTFKLSRRLQDALNSVGESWSSGSTGTLKIISVANEIQLYTTTTTTIQNMVTNNFSGTFTDCTITNIRNCLNGTSDFNNCTMTNILAGHNASSTSVTVQNSACSEFSFNDEEGSRPNTVLVKLLNNTINNTDRSVIQSTFDALDNCEVTGNTITSSYAYPSFRFLYSDIYGVADGDIIITGNNITQSAYGYVVGGANTTRGTGAYTITHSTNTLTGCSIIESRYTGHAWIVVTAL